MPKLKVEDLSGIAESARRAALLREGSGRAKVTVHMGTCGIAAGARDVISALLDEVEKRNLSDVLVTTSGCAGLCSREPMATVDMPGHPPVKYGDLNGDRMRQVLEHHVLGGNVVQEYAIAAGHERTA